MSSIHTPTRPALRVFGGKRRDARRIVALLPQHHTYAEPFGGGGAVLFAKPPSAQEVYNDLDGALVTFFRVCRDPFARGRLAEALRWTTYSRAEMNEALRTLAGDADAADPVEVARAVMVRAWMNRAQYGEHRGGGFRGYLDPGPEMRRGSARYVVRDWQNAVAAVEAVGERLRSVMIETTDAFHLLDRLDQPGTLVYFDPPYCPTTRGEHRYKHDFGAGDTARLLAWAAAPERRCMIVLSGYDTPEHEAMLGEWTRHEWRAQSDARTPRTECLWLNRAATARPSLFDQPA